MLPIVSENWYESPFNEGYQHLNPPVRMLAFIVFYGLLLSGERFCD